MRRLGIGGRLLLAHLAISAVVVGAVELALRSRLRDELTRQHVARLELAATALATRVAAGGIPEVEGEEIARATGFRISLVGADGYLEADSGLAPAELRAAKSHDHRREVIEARAGRVGSHRRVSATTGIGTVYVAVPGPRGTVARAAETEAQLHTSLATAERGVLGAAFLGLLVAGLLGALASRYAARAFSGLVGAARRLAEGDLAARAPVVGPRELAEVGSALNHLAEELARQVDTLVDERDLREAVLASMDDAVLVLRPDGRLLLANDAARERLSLPPEALGQPLVDSLRVPSLLDACREAFSGKPAAVELALHRPPPRVLVGRAAPLPRSGGGAAAVVVVLRDVTALRRLESVRREFVANASHELRTPVAAIRGYAETLAGGALADRKAAERFVAGLSRQAERLHHLLDDLLDLSRIESGGHPLVPQTLRVDETLSLLVDAVRDRAADQGLALVLDPVPPDLAVRADPTAVESVLGNLLDNALKYTPAGGRVTVSAAAAPGGRVRIDVRDTGPGIRPQHLSRIFERFYRVDPGRSREVGGTGLGLAIAKHLAQESGGELGVESTPGAGSRFWVLLPGAAAET